MQLLGRLSFSLYLWHWPLIAIATERAGHSLSHLTALMWVAVAVVLSFVTYTLVENPIRRARWLSSRLAVSIAVGALCDGGGSRSNRARVACAPEGGVSHVAAAFTARVLRLPAGPLASGGAFNAVRARQRPRGCCSQITFDDVGASRGGLQPGRSSRCRQTLHPRLEGRSQRQTSNCRRIAEELPGALAEKVQMPALSTPLSHIVENDVAVATLARGECGSPASMCCQRGSIGSWSDLANSGCPARGYRRLGIRTRNRFPFTECESAAEVNRHRADQEDTKPELAPVLTDEYLMREGKEKAQMNRRSGLPASVQHVQADRDARVTGTGSSSVISPTRSSRRRNARPRTRNDVQACSASVTDAVLPDHIAAEQTAAKLAHAQYIDTLPTVLQHEDVHSGNRGHHRLLRPVPHHRGVRDSPERRARGAACDCTDKFGERRFSIDVDFAGQKVQFINDLFSSLPTKYLDVHAFCWFRLAASTKAKATGTGPSNHPPPAKPPSKQPSPPATSSAAPNTRLGLSPHATQKPARAENSPPLPPLRVSLPFSSHGADIAGPSAAKTVEDEERSSWIRPLASGSSPPFRAQPRLGHLTNLGVRIGGPRRMFRLPATIRAFIQGMTIAIAAARAARRGSRLAQLRRIGDSGRTWRGFARSQSCSWCCITRYSAVQRRLHRRRCLLRYLGLRHHGSAAPRARDVRRRASCRSMPAGPPDPSGRITRRRGDSAGHVPLARLHPRRRGRPDARSAALFFANFHFISLRTNY